MQNALSTSPLTAGAVGVGLTTMLTSLLLVVSGSEYLGTILALIGQALLILLTLAQSRKNASDNAARSDHLDITLASHGAALDEMQMSLVAAALREHRLRNEEAHTEILVELRALATQVARLTPPSPQPTALDEKPTHLSD